MTFIADKIKINTDNPKKWYVSYTIKYSNGVTKYPKVYGGEYGIRLNDTQDDERIKKAERLLKSVKHDLSLGVDPKTKLDALEQEILADLAKSKGTTYDEAINIMIDYYNWNAPNESSALTAHNAKVFFNASFREFVMQIGKLDDVTSITKTDIEALLVQKNKEGKWNISTCKNKIGAISQLFIPLLDKGLIDSNPCRAIIGITRKLKRSPQKVTKKRFQVWTDEELKEFVSLANCDEYRFYYALGMTCYFSFIRRSECFRLKLGMLDFEARKFVIDSDLTKSAGKYNVSTIIYLSIPDELYIILEKYVQQRFGSDLNPDYYLFPSINSNSKKYPYFQFDVDYKRKLGCRLTNSKAKYDLKHTGVSHFWRDQIERGTPVALIITRLQKMCRHSNPLQTMKYLTTDFGIDFEESLFN